MSEQYGANAEEHERFMRGIWKTRLHWWQLLRVARAAYVVDESSGGSGWEELYDALEALPEGLLDEEG